MIDYCCHFMQRPTDYDMIVSNNKDFAKLDALQKTKWVTKEQENIYIPTYTDVLRVSFTHIFQRGKDSRSGYASALFYKAFILLIDMADSLC